jgi:flagellar FliJ protein
MSTPRFKFGLERVRELRAHDEDRAKEAFAASLEQRVRGAAQLADAARQLGEAQELQRREALGRSGTDLAAMQLWLERVEQSRHDAERRLHADDAELLHRRGQLTEASRRRQALDKLKERRAAEHALAAARAEGAFLDEIALNAHVRRSAA